MGLPEKRAIADYQAKEFPAQKKTVEDAVGGPVEMEVRWDTLAKEGHPDRYAEFFKKVYFQPLTDAFKAIAVDDMGKEALKGALKKIVIDGSSGHSSSGFTFVDGVLTLKHEPDANIEDVADRTKAIQKLIESKL